MKHVVSNLAGNTLILLAHCILPICCIEILFLSTFVDIIKMSVFLTAMDILGRTH